MTAYGGPVREERLAIELHNTLYASQGQSLDGLADFASLTSWLDAVGDRLPTAGTKGQPSAEELIALRHVVRDVLHAALDNRPPSRASIDALNTASARAPRSPFARWRRNRAPDATVTFHHASQADIVISAIAADAIDLITGASRHDLRACGAPGCVLMFLKRHSRREWCSDACGNRARQARHYQRIRGSDSNPTRSRPPGGGGRTSGR